MTSPSSRFPLLRIAFGNAILLSSVYLLLAIVAEIAHQVVGAEWADSILLALESLPARALHMVGLWKFLQNAYLEGSLNEAALRSILGTTMIVLIFAVALWVGFLLWLLRRFLFRSPSQTPGA